MITNYLDTNVFLKYFIDNKITKAYVLKIIDVEKCRKIREFEEVSHFSVYTSSMIPYDLNDTYNLTFPEMIKIMEERIFLAFKGQIKKDKLFKDYELTKEDFYNQQLTLKNNYCQITLKKTTGRLESSNEAAIRIQKEIVEMKKIYSALVNSSMDISVLDQLQDLAIISRHKENKELYDK